MQRLLAAMIAVCFTASALAQGQGPVGPPPSLVVLAFPSSDADAAVAAGVEFSLEEALAKAGAPLAPLDELFPDDSAPSLARGDQLFEQGRRLFDGLDCSKAARRFEDAATFYSKHPAQVRPEVFARAYLFLGGCRFLDGNREGAIEAFTRAAQIDPAAAPDKSLFAQDVFDAWKEAVAAVEARQKSRLHVDASPPGSQIRVRGVVVGNSPIPAIDVPSGLALVQVTRPGHQRYGTLAEVSAGKPSGVVTTLQPLPALQAMREIAAAMATEESFAAASLPAEAAAVADRMGARFLLLTRVEKGAARAQVWDVVTGNRLKGIHVEPGGGEYDDAARAVRDWLNNPSPADVGANLTATRLVKKWWFWTAIAGAAAVTGVVVYAATRPKAPPPMDL